MKFGMGSNTERTQTDARVKVQMTYVRPDIITIFNCVTPESVSFAFIGVNLGVTSHLTIWQEWCREELWYC